MLNIWLLEYPKLYDMPNNNKLQIIQPNNLDMIWLI